jgi:hypothetical protein
MKKIKRFLFWAFISTKANCMRINAVSYRFVFFFVFMYISITGHGQSIDDAFGVFSQADINLKECSFDKEADAVIISDMARSNYNSEYNLVTDRKIKFKILNEKGIDRGNIRIRYYSDEGFEFISDIEANVLSPDENGGMVKSNLRPKNIYRKQLNKITSEISFALPNVKVGSIIEYKYKSVMKHYGGLRDWYFQTDMPTMFSSYHLYIIPNSEFAYSVYKSHLLNIDIKPDNRDGSIYFSMKNVAGLRDEAYMASEKDYIQRVSFQLAAYGGYFGKKKVSTTWKELAKEMMEHKQFGVQLNKNLPGVEAVKAQWATALTPQEKMKNIFHYVRSTIIWTNIYSKYSENGIKEAWEKKRGYSGDINLILINLLQSENLEVYPLLVSERHHGKVDTTYPYIDQFNKVVALAVIEGKKYILDATDHKTPPHLIPFDLLNTIGFVVDKKKYSLMVITGENKKNVRLVNLKCTVAGDGAVQSSGYVRNFDYGRLDRIQSYKSNKAKYEQDFIKPYGNFKLDSFSLAGVESDSLPLEHNLKINYTLDKSGDYYLLNYNYFTGFDKNPFIATNRFSNIDFGTKYACTFQQSVSLPSNMEPETLPKSFRMVTPDNSMSALREIRRQGDKIEIGLVISINKPEFTAEEYETIRLFYKQLFEVLNEPIVLKTK